MATSRSATAEKSHSKELTTQRNAFRIGEGIEYDGKLAKVVNYGYLELPTQPGQDTQYSDAPVMHLQLPAEQPGGMPEYARFVPVDEVTSLRDNQKRLRELQKEFNPLFGDPTPAGEGQYNEPNVKGIGKEGREPAKRSGAADVARITPRSQRAPVDLSRTQAAQGKTVVTGSAPEKTAAPRGSKKGGSKKSSAKKSAAK